MLFEKNLLGNHCIEDMEIKYYVIRKNAFFGVGIEEYQTDNIQCCHEYFTEDQKEAYNLVLKLQEGKVTSVTLANIIDDYIH